MYDILSIHTDMSNRMKKKKKAPQESARKHKYMWSVVSGPLRHFVFNLQYSRLPAATGGATSAGSCTAWARAHERHVSLRRESNRVFSIHSSSPIGGNMRRDSLRFGHRTEPNRVHHTTQLYFLHAFSSQSPQPSLHWVGLVFFGGNKRRDFRRFGN